MTIIGRQSGIAWAPQDGLGTDDGNGGGTSKLVAATSTLYRWYPALTLDFAPQQIQTPAPPEVTGPPLPRGTYKGGAWATGNMTFMPRAPKKATRDGSHLHWLLWSLCGSMTALQIDPDAGGAILAYDYIYGGGGSGDLGTSSEIAGTWMSLEAELGGNPVDYGHYTFVPTAASGAVAMDNNYLSIKRLLPPDEDGNAHGETVSDCRVAGLTLEANPGGPLQATASFVGRVPKFYDNVTGNAWNPAYRDLAAFIPGLPDNDFYTTCRGRLALPATSGNENVILDLTAVQATVAISPNLTTVQQERILFSYFPEGYTTTGWNIGVQLTIKKGIYDLYDRIFFSGGNWTPTVWTAGEPFRILFETGTNMGANALACPYSIEFYAKKMTWSMEPIRTSADNIVAVQLNGFVEDPGDGYFAYFLRMRSQRNPALNENGVDPGTDYMKDWYPAN